MAAKKKAKKAPAPVSFEEAIEELEALTERLAHEPDSLSALVDDYERGQTLITFCNDALKSARDRITVIQATIQKKPEESSSKATLASSDENDDVRLF